jgi:hypothetical protein
MSPFQAHLLTQQVTQVTRYWQPQSITSLPAFLPLRRLLVHIDQVAFHAPLHELPTLIILWHQLSLASATLARTARKVIPESDEEIRTHTDTAHEGILDSGSEFNGDVAESDNKSSAKENSQALTEHEDDPDVAYQYTKSLADADHDVSVLFFMIFLINLKHLCRHLNVILKASRLLIFAQYSNTSMIMSIRTLGKWLLATFVLSASTPS